MKKRKVFLTLFFLIILSVGFGNSVPGIDAFIKAHASRGWPRVPGMVKAAAVTSGAGGHWARIRYDYRFNKAIHSAERVSFTRNGPLSLKEARAVVARYPQGAYIAVFYDPMDPRVSVLEPGVGWGNYLPLIVGFFLVLAGLSGLLSVFSGAEY